MRRELSVTENTVMLLLVEEGLGILDIAKRMNMSPSTVSTHVRRAGEKLDAKSSLQAAVFFDRRRRPANDAA